MDYVGIWDWGSDFVGKRAFLQGRGVLVIIRVTYQPCINLN